jgi:hypothetical protein
MRSYVKMWDIQSVPGGKVNILGGHSIGHSKQKVYTSILFGTVSERELFHYNKKGNAIPVTDREGP